MSRGPRRGLIPLAFLDMMETWPRPDEASLLLSDPYFGRKKAVTMYATQASNKDILSTTGITAKECRRLVKRCVQYCPSTGQIYGFTALLHGKRIKEYHRIQPITVNANGQINGCAGALQGLFAKYPDVEIYVEELYLKKTDFKGATTTNQVHEARIPINKLHGLFLKMLRTLGFTSYDWPFNTSNQGYNALRNHCKALREGDPDLAMEARSGKQASQNSGKGKGKASLINAQRPYSVVQLDFHKVDAACTILIETAHGVELELPVARWHIGMLVDEHPKTILGLYISLEKTPSADCVLETIENALRPETIELADPRWRFAQDGKVLIYQFVPQLEWQCFSVIKMDNAWSNIAHDVVNNILATVGCAVNFGPVRAWWRRALIERMFGCLEQLGIQRLPSTYGSGTDDTRKNDPHGQAVKLSIRLSDVVAQIFGTAKKINSEPTEGNFWASPLQVVTTMLEKPKSGLFSMPLPKPAQHDLMLMRHIEEVVVRGNINKNRSPYFISDRCEYRSDRLSLSYGLVGKKLLAYIDRRDVRNVVAVIKETGVCLGPVVPELKWRKARCSWRMRKYLNRSGFANRYKGETCDPINEFLVDTAKELIKKNSRGKNKGTAKGSHSATQSLHLAKTLVNTTKLLPESPMHEPKAEDGFSGESQPLPKKPLADPFRLCSFPNRIDLTRDVE